MSRHIHLCTTEVGLRIHLTSDGDVTLCGKEVDRLAATDAQWLFDENGCARCEVLDYDALLTEAEHAGVPTSLDDPKSPRTVAALRHAITSATPKEK